MSWNEERIDALKRLWGAGYSASAIGKMIGVSKNAVVGKAHRLKLPARPSPIKRGEGTTTTRRNGPPKRTRMANYPESLSTELWFCYRMRAIQSAEQVMSASQQSTPNRHGIWIGIAAMAVVVTSANILVQYPINDWLTWGAFTYPISFLVTDLTNRALGPSAARRVVYVGFALAVILSLLLAPVRIALASGTAFLAAQLLDIYVFDRLRRGSWWRAPLISSTAASALDTALFFALAFAGTAVPWVTLAIGDYGVKLALAAFMLIPFRALMGIIRAQRGAAGVKI